MHEIAMQPKMNTVGGGVATRQSQVPAAIDTLSRDIEGLTGAIEELQAKLVPVCVVDAVAVDKKKEVTPPSNLCAVAERLRYLSEAVTALRMKVQDIFNRCEC